MSEKNPIQRLELFEALTGNKGVNLGGGDVTGMLRTVYGVMRGDDIKIDTREAARRLGVSQRTIQRWIKGTNAPSADHAKKLRTRSRQAATTKRGRARALRRTLGDRQFETKGAQVRVQGHQGPQDYARDRSSQLTLSPEEYQGVLAAYAEGGDGAVLDYLEAVYGDKYVDNWKFGEISGFRLDGLGGVGAQDPRAR